MTEYALKRVSRLVFAGVILSALCVFFQDTGFCAENRFKISLSVQSIPPGRQARLSLDFSDKRVKGMPPPSIPYVEGLDIKFRDIAEFPDGAVSYVYGIAGLYEGEYAIGPFSFEYQGRKYVSDKALLEVSRKAVYRGADAAPEDKKDASAGVEKRIFIEADIPGREFYVNQKIPVSVKFYTDWLDVEDLRISDVPAKEYITGDYTSGSTVIEQRPEAKYAVLEFNKWFFVPSSGDYVFGPVKGVCRIAKRRDKTLNPNEDFYNEYIGAKNDTKIFEMDHPEIAFTVIPLPSKGRPAMFKGAVGGFSMDAAVSPLRAALGEPFNVEIRISGEGNYNMVTVPEFENTSGISVSEARTFRNASSVTFKFSVKAVSAGIKSLPRIMFCFFDPLKREYSTVSSGPFPVEIDAPDVPAAAEPAVTAPAAKPAPGASEEKFGEGVIYLKDSPGKLRPREGAFYKSGSFGFLLILPVLVLIASFPAGKQLEKFRTDKEYAARLKALKASRAGLAEAGALMKKGSQAEFYGHIFKLMQNYLGARFSADPSGVTEEIIAEKISSPGGEFGDLYDRVKNIFSDCYLARYTDSEFGEKDMEKTYEAIKEALSRMDKIKHFSRVKKG